ncbi:aminopeptidase P family protein [Sneathiella sp.]|uniref:aminopeptidase P family protein n=1 Tax=Sneathiella sp. TaxID=1964365 RepID=UPI00356476B7
MRKDTLSDTETLNDRAARLAPKQDPGIVIQQLRAAAAAPARGDEDLVLKQVFPELSGANLDEARNLRDAYRQEIRDIVLAPNLSAERLAKLRRQMAVENLDGFIVPLNDEFHGEAAPASSERLKWLTGFTGSAGTAAVLKDKAAIFVDGRYTLQVQNEVDTTLFAPRHVSNEPMSTWLSENMAAGETLAVDPWLHTENNMTALRQLTADRGIALKPVETNLIDSVWEDRPPPPLALVVPQETAFSGESSADKRAAIAGGLLLKNVDAVVHTLPDVIAWLLNIRGADLPCTPFALGFAILHKDATVELFMDRQKLSVGLKEHLGNAVHLFSPEDFGDQLGRLTGKHVQIDPAVTSQWIVDRLEEASALISRADDPCLLPKAIKNAVEIAGTRAAHVRDGAAVSKFLHWLSEKASGGDIDELAAEAKLRKFRRSGENFKDLSFPTISGAGPNGAIVHYRATTASNRALAPGSLYLVDSGAQYLDGTTDITRTVAIGEPTAEMRNRFTLVLKGHIALAMAVFPKGTTGSQLDPLARAPLWAAGLDYDHGTGHGVGSYLSVHEGPQRISKAPSAVALIPGMIISNEPGYYKTGAYGIRIENLVTVREVDGPAGAEREVLGFETLTLAPIDRNLIDRSLLSAREREWLDGYHAAVREKISPLVGPKVEGWLKKVTAPI